MTTTDINEYDDFKRECPAVGSGGVHTDEFYDGGFCQWCGGVHTEFYDDGFCQCGQNYEP